MDTLHPVNIETIILLEKHIAALNLDLQRIKDECETRVRKFEADLKCAHEDAKNYRSQYQTSRESFNNAYDMQDRKINRLQAECELLAKKRWYQFVEWKCPDL